MTLNQSSVLLCNCYSGCSVTFYGHTVVGTLQIVISYFSERVRASSLVITAQVKIIGNLPYY
jgi:hypothetical protein